MLSSAFYRNKAAYVLGKLVNGHDVLPFVVPVLHGTDGRLELDAILLDPLQINVLFSLSRAYFMVDMEVPSGYVEFLRSMAPTRAAPSSTRCSASGSRGRRSSSASCSSTCTTPRDQFVEAPGIRGQVMLVFTLPSFRTCSR